MDKRWLTQLSNSGVPILLLNFKTLLDVTNKLEGWDGIMKHQNSNPLPIILELISHNN